MTLLMEEIRKAILTGDIDRAISLTQTFYPTVLEKNEPIHFRLRARKFVEMMRMCADGTGPGSTTTKSIDSPDTEKMAIDTGPQEEDEQVDDEVHMTDVTPSHHNTKFVIDDDEEDSEDDDEEQWPRRNNNVDKRLCLLKRWRTDNSYMKIIEMILERKLNVS